MNELKHYRLRISNKIDDPRHNPRKEICCSIHKLLSEKFDFPCSYYSFFPVDSANYANFSLRELCPLPPFLSRSDTDGSYLIKKYWLCG